jgi:cell fate regulator YaaT (PSP1 superfamily)
LKCCLRYEFDIYEDLQKQFPPLGSIVITPDGRGKVVGHEILNGQLQVLTDDHRRLTVPFDKAELDQTAPPIPLEPEPEMPDQEEDRQIE